jgi:tRNA dimethylallyltransferase
VGGEVGKVNKLLVVAGPTASGKSALALRLAEEFAGTIINADSMQVYQWVPILTAQPTDAERARAPHLLYGVIPPEQSCSAGIWRQMASEACAQAWAEGRLPLLVGGTGLYIRSLLQGLSPIPDIPEPVRDASRRLLAELGNEEFHKLLAARDPVIAGRLDPGNSQRLARAWEVLQATGRSLAEWQAEPRQGGLAADSRIIAVLPPRQSLYAACDRRLESMLQQGALAEVERLLARHLDPALPVMKALGVAEFAAHLRGECTLAQALAAAQRATRNYAKRQMTWFRHQLIADYVVSAQFSETECEKIFSFIRSFR